MGSKKHKKESKKKKHRSRSRSPLEGEVRERKKHKKHHKDRKRDRSLDVEEVPVDSHLIPAEENGDDSRSRGDSFELESGRERDRRLREERHHHREHSYEYERVEDSPVASGSGSGSGRANGSAGASGGGGGAESLSIEETNRLRAKLGLKPLEVAEPPADDGKIKDDLGEFYHKPAANLSAKKKGDKLRERLDERREKRTIEQKLQNTTLLAEDDADDDAAAWVRKSREVQKQKQEAAKRAAMLDEMDAVFGVSALVADDERATRAGAYGANALKGLRVAHDIDAIGDERETVLTLADKDVLAEDAEDVLVNVNLLDDERYKKNQEELKKARAGYQAYDDEAELEAAALGARPVLAKYDGELDKQQKEREKGFLLGDDAARDVKRVKDLMLYKQQKEREKGFLLGDDSARDVKRVKDLMRLERLQGGVNKRLESLQLPALQIASEYMDEHEIQAKFKKPKRKGKMRRKPKDEPVDVDDDDAAVAPLLTDDTDVKPSQLMELVVDDEEVEPDSELQVALARARRLRQAEASRDKVPKMEEILETVKQEADGSAADGAGAGTSAGAEGAMVLDATAEFCRTLGDIPTYGQAGNRDTHAEIMDFEREDLEASPSDDEAAAAASGAWSLVDVAGERAKQSDGAAALAQEPALGAGVAGALSLALSLGYLERPGAAPAPRPAAAHLLHAKHYSIEDKSYVDDDKHGRRERSHGGHGPLQDFKEKSSFRPNIKLEYVDDDGRPLCPKEAFRYLSHKFHGKGPGKNKQEKRIKKAVQEGLMKKMSSTDTPLGTLQMLQDKQRETHSPYIVLSGAKRDGAQH